MNIDRSNKSGDQPQQPTEGEPGSLQGRKVSSNLPTDSSTVELRPTDHSPRQKSLFGRTISTAGDLKKQFSNWIWGATTQTSNSLTESVKHFTAKKFIRALEDNEYLVNVSIVIKENVNLRAHDDAVLLPFSKINFPISVGGYLNLAASGLTSLPENLSVGGHLNLDCCTGLTSLPENLRVGSNLDLSNCTGITSLPNWITELGDLPYGGIREVSLQNTGLSDEILERLRNTPAPGMRFIYGHRAAALERDVFASLDEAFEFWNECIPEEKRSQNPNLSVDQHSKVSVCTFLTSLTNTADYKNKTAQPVLAQRVIDILKLMSEDKKISELACELIHHGQTSCDDRLITAMDELELMVRVHNTEGEQNLRRLAKGIVMLEKVQQRARSHMKTLQWVDEIEVDLAFKIALTKKLDLPLSTKNMIFRSCAQISDTAIQKAGDEIKAEVTDTDVKKYLKDWVPWHKHLRKKQVVSFVKLKKIKHNEPEAICSLTLSPLAELEQPIRYGNNVYEYDAFVKAFIESGLDPSNRQPISFAYVARISK